MRLRASVTSELAFINKSSLTMMVNVLARYRNNSSAYVDFSFEFCSFSVVEVVNNSSRFSLLCESMTRLDVSKAPLMSFRRLA